MMEQLPNIGLEILSGSLCGFLIGLVYFQQLMRSVEIFCRGSAPVRLVLGTLLRVAGAVAVFVLLMHWSALATISALIGFSFARSRVVANREMN